MPFNTTLTPHSITLLKIESENWDYAQSEFFICLRQFIALSEGSFAPSADNFLYLGLKMLTLGVTKVNSKRYES